MGAHPATGLSQFEEQAAAFFEPKLAALGLSVQQIESQDLPALEESRLRIDKLMEHPEQLGFFRARVSADATWFIAKSSADSQVETGALPILLSRKALILDRIKLLRPLDQLETLREEITNRVDDPAKRSELLRMLEAQHAREQARSARLAEESHSLESALEADRALRGQGVALAELKVRVDGLDKALAEKSEKLDASLVRLEDKSVSKWDVVTVVFAVMAAIGGLLGAGVALIRWISGG